MNDMSRVLIPSGVSVLDIISQSQKQFNAQDQKLQRLEATTQRNEFISRQIAPQLSLLSSKVSKIENQLSGQNSLAGFHNKSISDLENEIAEIKRKQGGLSTIALAMLEALKGIGRPFCCY